MNASPVKSPPPLLAAIGSPRIAVVGAGVAGAACAAGLRRAGLDVTVFDKSRGVGGRMATRRARWVGADGQAHCASFDHGCPHFTVTRPRFQSAVDRAVALGHAARWQQQVHAAFPAPRDRQVIVPTPDLPAFCRHLLAGLPLQLGRTVTGLQRCPEGWLLHSADEATEDRIDGPFRQVVLAIPPAQAAMLLRGHRSDWADALAAVPMAPCWTLMAVTDALDWPWDAAELEGDDGELAWVVRNDRAPGRRAASACVPWVAHASPAWSRVHLEDDPAQVAETLRAALGSLIGGAHRTRWHHAAAHRWRYAQRAAQAPAAADAPDCLWSEALGLGVCGDAFGGAAGGAFGDGSVESAWCTGDELADTMAASLDATTPAAALPPTELVETAH